VSKVGKFSHTACSSIILCLAMNIFRRGNRSPTATNVVVVVVVLVVIRFSIP